MNMPDKASFGPVSREVHLAVASAVQALEDKPKMARRMPIAALAAALILILGTTAFAIANRAMVADFFDKWNRKNGYELPGTFTDVVRADKPLLVATAGDLDVVVTDAVGDGETYYLATTLSLRAGVQGHLVNRESLENGFLSAPTFGDDLPVYYVTLEIVHGGAGTNIIDWIDNEDGSVTYLRDPIIEETGDLAAMECWVTYARTDDGFPPLQNQFVTEKLPFELPVERK